MSTTLSLLTCVQQSSKAPLTSLQALAETMVDTRQSPGKGQRRSSRGMPPLPTQKKKTAVKHNKKKQPTSKQVAAAKEKTKQQEMEKNKPIEVKEEIMNSKRRLWTDEEDIAACKGYVNITCDPVAGAQQNKDEFWMRVTKKMYQFLGVDAEVADVHKPWSHQSVKTRITKTIGKQTQLFNGYYHACAKDNDSGWTKEMHMEAACNLFLETEGKPFKFSTCARILHQCPKFKPAEKSTAVGGEEEDGKPQAVANTVASIQGKGLQKPLGSKKAKKLALEKKLEADSVATAAHTEAVFAVAKSAADLSRGFDKKRRIDSMHKSVDAYLRLGDSERARAILQEIDILNAEDDKKPAATPASASVPTSINIDDQEDQEREVEEEEEEVDDEGMEEVEVQEVVEVMDSNPTFTFKSLPNALDDEDDASSEEDVESNHSQSDDSKLVKRLPV